MHGMCDKVVMEENTLISLFGPQCTHDNMRNVKFTNTNGLPWRLKNEDAIVKELLHDHMVPRWCITSTTAAANNNNNNNTMPALHNQLVELEHYLFTLMHVSSGGFSRAISYTECMHLMHTVH